MGEVSPLGFGALINALLLTLMVPIVVFYFLKLKRPRVQIPSLALWRQVMRDNRVNSPFQRFKRNLLLLLQLMLLALLAGAAMQPFWRGRAGLVERLPVLIDCSASMAALEQPGGPSRLQVARKEATKIVDEMLPDQQLCIVSFSDSARTLTDFTSNKRVLRAALEGLTVDDVPSGMQDVMRVAQALALTAPFDEVLLLSDGNVPAETDFELSFKLNYRRLPAAGPNVGITSLSARRAEGGLWDVFVSVEATSQFQGGAKVELQADGREALTEDVSFVGGGTQRLIFRMPGESRVRIGLEPEGFDSLPVDNAAFIDLPTVRPLSVYVGGGDGMEAFRHALRAHADVQLFTGGDPAPGDAYDLVISDRPEDQALAAQVALYVGMVPDELTDLVSVGDGGSEVVDWDRAQPLFEHVELGDLVMIDRPQSAEGVTEGSYENRGFQVLVHGSRGPLVLERSEGERRLFCFLFHPDRSTLPYRVGFPVMVANAVRLAMFESALAEVQAARTGVLPPITLSPESSYRVTGPDGTAWEDRADADGTLSGIPARRVGYYQVTGPGESVTKVGAALLSSSESSLAGVEEILFNEGLSVQAAGAPPRTDRSLWRSLAFLGFGILLVEWWYFQRRP